LTTPRICADTVTATADTDFTEEEIRQLQQLEQWGEQLSPRE
jgi:hypothetical protein